MRRREPAVSIELRIVKYDVEVLVAQRAAGGIEIEFGNRIGHFARRLAVFGVKFQRVVAESERSGFELLEDVFVFEEK